jgi:hypothetical protein
VPRLLKNGGESANNQPSDIGWHRGRYPTWGIPSPTVIDGLAVSRPIEYYTIKTSPAILIRIPRFQQVFGRKI